MEKKVKIDLPKKYAVGIEVMVPMIDDNSRKACRKMLDIIVSTMGGNSDDAGRLCNLLETEGKGIASAPLLHSIAETKMTGLNKVFAEYGIPLQAFLEKEDSDERAKA